MNELYFEGKVAGIYSEDFIYLQDTINSELLKLIDITVVDGLDSYVSLCFKLEISSGDNTKLYVSQESSTGVVISKSGLIIQSSTGVDLIALSSSSTGVVNNVYCRCYTALASYDRVSKLIVEEAKLQDLQSYTLVYNRQIDKFSIVVYTNAEYAALTQSEKDELVFLGSTIAQGAGQPLVSVDLSQVNYLMVIVRDGSITLSKLNPNFILPQTMVEPTSTGLIDDHYYEIPASTRIIDDLNYIRTEIRDIKGTINWDDILIGMRSEISEITKQYKTGVFLEIEGGLEVSLTSSGASLLIRKGSALIGNLVKRIEEDVVLPYTPRYESTVSAEFHTIPHFTPAVSYSFYLAQTSTGNITARDVSIIDASDQTFVFSLGIDYLLNSSTGLVTALGSGSMIDISILCSYKYYKPRIDTLVLTSSGLSIREGVGGYHPEPVVITSSGVFPLYYIVILSLQDIIGTTDLIDVRIPRLELREVREIQATDNAMYDSLYEFNPLSYYNPHKLSVIQTSTGIYTSTGYLNNMDVWDFKTQNTYPVMMLSSSGIVQTIIHTQKDDELWLYGVNNTSTGIVIQLAYATSTGVYDATTYTTIPRSDALDFVPVGYKLADGFELGYHKIRISCPSGINQSAWSTSTSVLNTPRLYTAGCGLKAAALVVGGYSSSILASSEKFNGFTWTSESGWDLATNKDKLEVVGVQNSALSFGGDDGSYSSVTERFNGSVWSSVAGIGSTFGVGRWGVAGAGSTHSVLCFGGYGGSGVLAITTFFDGFVWSTSRCGVLSTSACGTLNTPRYFLAGCGLKNAALSFGGTSTGYVATTEKFDGVNWSASVNLNVARTLLAGCGSQNLALSFGGTLSGAEYFPTTEKFNGNAWSTNSTWNSNTPRFGLSGCGIQSSALASGGKPSGSVNSAVTEKFITSNFQFNKLVIGKLDTDYDRSLLYTEDFQSNNIQSDIVYVDGTVTSNESILALVNADLFHGSHASPDITLGDNSDYLISTEKAIKTYVINYLDYLDEPLLLSDDVNTFTIPLDAHKPVVKIIINNLQGEINQNFWTTNFTWFLNTARYHLSGCGTITSTISFGGYALSYSATTEIFNGIAWSNSGSLVVARYGLMGCGIQNAALAGFGYDVSVRAYTEKFNGNSWINVGTPGGTARRYLGGCGIQGAAVALGGTTGSSTAVIEKFNGLTWSSTSAGTLSDVRYKISAVGIQNASLIIGGYDSLTTVDSYNGSVCSALSAGGYLGIGRHSHASSGVSNSCLAFGGVVVGGSASSTEKYNSLCWSTDPNQTLTLARNSLSGSGSQSAALAFGGTDGTISAVTEKFIGIVPVASYVIIQSSTGSLSTTNIEGLYNNSSCEFIVYPPVTVQLNAVYKTWQTQEEYDQLSTLGKRVLYSNDIWVTIVPLNTSRYYLAGCGTQNSALSFGGYTVSSSRITELFDGYTWANIATLTMTPRRELAGCGIANAALSIGGNTGSTTNAVELFNGTIWSSGGALGSVRKELAGCGIQNAATAFGGWIAAISAATEKFDGSTWSASGDLNVARRYLAGCGSQNAGLSFGGIKSSNIISEITEKFNGSTWSILGSLIIARGYLSGSGSQSAALSFGGATDYGITRFSSITQKFNGFVWLGTTDLNIARYGLAGAGTQSASLCFGAFDLSYLTEKFISPVTANYSFLTRGVWTATGSLNTARVYLAGAGIQSAALSFGGEKIASPYYCYETESFNGLTWTNITATPLMRGRLGLAGAGIQNSALSFGGSENGADYLKVTEKFDGSVWSASGDLITARSYLAGCGVQNAALSFGGLDSSTYSATTEKFNIDTWSSEGDIIISRRSPAGCGIQNAALNFGGFTGTGGFNHTHITEKFNGSTWSASGDLNLARYGLSGSGVQNAALSFGGFTDDFGILSITESFNGSIWSVSSNLITSRRYLAGAGTQNAALSFGGYVAAASAITEKYINNYITAYTSPVSGFVSTTVASLNTAREKLAGCGVQNAALSFGGEKSASPSCHETEFFDGSTWSAKNDLTIARSYLAGCGIQNAALSFGGSSTGVTSVNVTELYNGVSWVQATAAPLNTAKSQLAGCGIQNAALSFGGYSNTYSAKTEKFNGLLWVEDIPLNLARYGLAGCGIQNAALSFGGTTGSYSQVTEKFNGSVWSYSGDLNVARRDLAGAGIQNVALSFGGYAGTSLSTIEAFNGFLWKILGYLNTGRQALAGCGVQNSALSFGGDSNNSKSAVTEKFSGITTKDYLSPITGTWTISNDLNIARSYLAGAGIQSAGLSFGGTSTGITNVTESFNGYYWTTVVTSSMTARSELAGCGIQGAALSFGGTTGTRSAITESFNGSVWVAEENLNTARSGLSGCGIQLAALSFGGTSTGLLATTEKFNGSLWTATGSLNAPKKYLAGCGLQNAAVAFGGTSTGYVSITETFDGSTWSCGGDLIIARGSLAGCGIQNAALSYGGLSSTGLLAITEKFNGGFWSLSYDLGVPRKNLAGCGKQQSALSFGGYISSSSSVTEKFIDAKFDIVYRK